ARIETDRGREAHIIEDAEAALIRIDATLAELVAKAEASPGRIPELTDAWRSADADRATADAEVERLAALVAEAEAERRGAQTRVADAEGRVNRSRRALDLAR